MKFDSIQAARQLLVIDRNHLDDELEMQSEYYYAVSERYTEACENRDRSKDRLTTAQNRAIDTARRKYSEAGTKFTEAQLTQESLLDSNYQAELELHGRYRKEAADWANMQESFRSRGYMLRELCHLYSANYFTTNSVKTAGADTRTRDAEIGRQGMNEKRRSRTALNSGE